MKLLYKLTINISGYGFVFNQFINLCLEFTFHKKKQVVAEKFIHSLVDKYGRHTVYTDGGTWYPKAYTFLLLKHRLQSPPEKSLIERICSISRIEVNILMMITILVLA